MTSAKPQKEKTYAATPRLVPRPTAASAARAARNATNRNLIAPATQRQSPTRSLPSSDTSKMKTAISRSGQKFEPKTSNEMKINRNFEREVLVSELNDTDAYLTVENMDKILELKTEGQIVFSNDDAQQQEIIHDPEPFETKTLEEIPPQKQVDSDMKEETKLSSIELPLMSRPQTPKSVSSRPQTPRLPSRPSTPGYLSQRHSTPVSRPNTPQRTTPSTKLRTPSLPASSLPRPITPVASLNSPSSVIKEGEDLKSLYSTKRSQFHRMKKDLDLKQQAILEVLDGLRTIREHMVQKGIPSKESGREDLVVFNVADWAPEEMAQLCRDAVASSATDGAVELFNTTVDIDERALAEVESKALHIPGCFADLCLQAFTARQELIDWVKELIESHGFGGNDAVDRIACYNTQGLELCEALRELKSQADEAVDNVTSLFKRVYNERTTLLAVGESLVREIAHLRQDLEARNTVIIEKQEIRVENDVTKVLEETRRKLDDERAAKNSIKDKLAIAESQLRQARLRVSKMDKQLRESEASIASLTGTVKSLEDQNRQREVHLEARARKLKESLKTGEMTSNQLAQKRDSLQAEVNELKEQIQTITAQNKTDVQDLNNKLKELLAALEEEKNVSQKEAEEKQQLEMSLNETHNVIEVLKAKITELENSKPNPDLPTEREIDLWAELQATKDTLRNTEDEVAATKREKVRFLETLTKIADSENKVGLQQKLAAELLSKEEIVAKMQTQIRELTKNIKLNEQKVIQYEQYVRNLQAHNCAVANCQEAPNGISYQDLQQEIMSLRMRLLDAVHRNEELSEMLMQKDQQLEQQDKTSRAQARVIKVREELINMLKNKETEQSRELTSLQQDLEHRMKIVDEVNKQIAAKADEIQELFATLETKQQQIHRLEKIVLALEEQQRRAQAQRTRHEEKIAALEHELAAGGNRRERKFLFF